MASKKDHTEHMGKDEHGVDPDLAELRASFLSIAAHEFKTPLTGILSSLNLIDRYLESDEVNWARFKHREKVRNHLRKIQQSATNLSTILNKFLSVQSLERGEIPLNIVRADLKRLLGNQVKQMQNAAKPGQNIIYTHTSQLRLAALDKNVLRNIMNNLLSNAIKFSPPHTEIRIRSHLSPDSIRIEVTDQGVGIPPAEQEKVFRQFYRARNIRISEEGTGLGLYIVKRYADRLGGSIELNSRVNQGTSIILTLPNKPLYEEDSGD